MYFKVFVKCFFSQRSVTLESADFRNYTLNDRSSLSIFKTTTSSPPFLKHDEYSIEVWWLTEKVTDLIVKSPLVPKRARRRQNYHSQSCSRQLSHGLLLVVVDHDEEQVLGHEDHPCGGKQVADWLKKWMACRATDPLSRLVAAALKVSDPSPHPHGAW